MSWNIITANKMLNFKKPTKYCLFTLKFEPWNHVFKVAIRYILHAKYVLFVWESHPQRTFILSEVGTAIVLTEDSFPPIQKLLWMEKLYSSSCLPNRTARFRQRALGIVPSVLLKSLEHSKHPLHTFTLNLEQTR